MATWASNHNTPAAPQNLSRKIQGLVREARCYPPEREPRIVRDVYDCCRHFAGLRPRLQACVVDPSQSQTVRMLVLDGVIPITYRGVTYQIPVLVWCRPHYPNDAPVPYVRPTPSMVIRERHANVDKEGRVYLQHYLSVWDPSQFSMYGLVLAMIRVFSANPPVNSRPTVSAAAVDEPERRRLISALEKRISDRLADVNHEAVTEVAQLLERKDAVVRSGETASAEAERTRLQYENKTEALRALQVRKQELNAWQAATANTSIRKIAGDEDRMKEEGGEEKENDDDEVHEDDDEEDVDALLQYRDMMTHQIAENMAKDHAFTDTLDQVDEAFVKGVIDHDTYVKDVRNLSREQFFPRALRKRLELARVRAAQTADNSTAVAAGMGVAKHGNGTAMPSTSAAVTTTPVTPVTAPTANAGSPYNSTGRTAMAQYVT